MIKLTVKKLNKKTMQIEDVCVSQKWNNDDEQYKTLNEWIRNITFKSKNLSKKYSLKNSIVISNTVSNHENDSIGRLLNRSNCCQFNASHLAIFSGDFSGNAECWIYPQNFDRVVASYSARSLVPSNWLNNNDEYQIPLGEIQMSEKYKQFVNDCHVYSLFSLQSSMRDVPNFDDTTFDIFNHFFFMSNEEMKDLANEWGFKEMYQDANEHYEDRFMYNKLQELELSNDAKDILENLRELVRKSMKYRELAHQEDEKFHLNTWDAGWYQIKMGILKKYMKEELKEFMTKFKAFENRLRPLVYEFGFLPHENKIMLSQ